MKMMTKTFLAFGFISLALSYQLQAQKTNNSKSEITGPDKLHYETLTPEKSATLTIPAASPVKIHTDPILRT